MGTLAIGCVLFGMILGKFFKWPVLVPAFGLAIVLVLVNPAHLERTFLVLFLHIVVVSASLQIGYFIGIFALNSRRAPKHSGYVRVRTPEETRTPAPAPHKRDGKAA